MNNIKLYHLKIKSCILSLSRWQERTTKCRCSGLHLASAISAVCLLNISYPANASEQKIEWQKGFFKQGGLVAGKIESGAKIMVDGIKVPIDKDGSFVIGFGRDHPKTAKIIITDKDGNKRTEAVNIEQRKYNIQRINGVQQSKVNPPRSKALQQRISKEVKEIGAARRNSADKPLFKDGFILPIDKFRISGVYGSQRVLNGTPKRPHYGIDYAAPAGTSAKSPADGIIRMVQNDNYFSGGTVIIDHGHNLSSAFLHLQKINVKNGDKVARGDIVGEVGSTGRSTGPHLDWRINWFNRRIDPDLVLKMFREQAH